MIIAKWGSWDEIQILFSNYLWFGVEFLTYGDIKMNIWMVNIVQLVWSRVFALSSQCSAKQGTWEDDIDQEVSLPSCSRRSLAWYSHIPQIFCWLEILGILSKSAKRNKLLLSALCKYSYPSNDTSLNSSLNRPPSNPTLASVRMHRHPSVEACPAFSRG